MITAEIQIRPYTPSDKIACIEAFKTNVPLYFTAQEAHDFEGFLKKIATNDGQKTIETHYFVVVFEDKIVGCGGFGDKDNQDIITLAWGLIHNDFHRKGFGKALLLHRLQLIKQLYPYLPLIVDTTQHSYTFFEKLGFRTTKITPDFYAVGLDRYDMVFEKNDNF